eukprot:4670673-Prymnesium_polylepis.1
MCAEITGLTTDVGKTWNTFVGRVSGRAPDHPDLGVRWAILTGDRSGYASGQLDDFAHRTAAAAPTSAPYAVRPSELLLRWPDFNLSPARTCRRWRSQ